MWIGLGGVGLGWVGWGLGRRRDARWHCQRCSCCTAGRCGGVAALISMLWPLSVYGGALLARRATAWLGVAQAGAGRQAHCTPDSEQACATDAPEGGQQGHAGFMPAPRRPFSASLAVPCQLAHRARAVHVSQDGHLVAPLHGRHQRRQRGPAAPAGLIRQQQVGLLHGTAAGTGRGDAYKRQRGSQLAGAGAWGGSQLPARWLASRV